MTFTTRLLTTSFLAAVMLGCEAELLSLGELRCRAVACGPHELSESEQLAWEETEHVRLEGTVAARSIEVPCPGRDGCSKVGTRMRLLEREGVSSPLTASLLLWVTDQPDPDDAVVWVGRYEGGAWHAESTIELDAPRATQYQAGVTIASDEEKPDEAIVLVDEVMTPGDPASRKLRAFHFDAGDALSELFEVVGVGYVHDAARLRDDVIIIDEYESLFEVTRYGADGTLRWRQTSLLATSGITWDSVVSWYAELRVLDEEHIAVLVPRPDDGVFEVVMLDGAGNVQWSHQVVAFSNDEFASARLEVEDDGRVVVGTDGYSLDRVELREGKLFFEIAGRSQEAYFDLEVYGIDIGASGWTYIGTQDGVRDEHVELIERISPDYRRTESIEVEVPFKRGCQRAFNTPVRDIRVSRDERTAFVANTMCLIEVPLPPIEEPVSLGD